MERYSLIVVTDETRPIRRFDVEKRKVQRSVVAAALAAILLLAGMVDYVVVRIDHLEIDSLRSEAAKQRARIASFEAVITDVETKLSRVKEFERKIRTIANLPGSVATGGDEVVEVGPSDDGDLANGPRGGDEVAPLVRRGVETLLAPGPSARTLKSAAGASDSDRVSLLRQEAVRLGLVAEGRELSLMELVEQLENKHQRLVSSPAIWPTQGWLTSRFGSRVSPFTGQRQFHSGIDIAGAQGTDVVASADGTVKHSGKKGPLGNTVIIDHGNGVKTFYGHTKELFVKRGEKVVRGQRIASLGNSGRSTGPHLHYSVEVKGKAVNPLDYIFD